MQQEILTCWERSRQGLIEQVQAEVRFEGAGHRLALTGNSEGFEAGHGFGSFSRAAKEG